jgi:peptidyl-prolyl cis-trans isomerase C
LPDLCIEILNYGWSRKMVKWIVCISLIFVVLLVMGSVKAEESEEPQEPAAAVVNGKRILMTSLTSRVQAVVRDNPELRARENIEELRKMRKDILNELIDEELIIQEGIEIGLKPREIEISTELSKIKQRFPDEGTFQQVLKQQKLTEEKLNQIIERALIGKKMLDIKIKPTAKPVTDEDIAAFYEENKEQFVREEEMKASHILLKVEQDADEQEKTSAKSEMQAILEKARSGEDFAELAKEHSQCPSAPQGGDLGYFPRGMMVKPFEEAAFSLEKGQVSDIVETQFGYHIILGVDKKTAGPMKLEEVSEDIRKILDEKEVNAALKKWLEPVRKKATIEILFKG